MEVGWMLVAICFLVLGGGVVRLRRGKRPSLRSAWHEMERNGSLAVVPIPHDLTDDCEDLVFTCGRVGVVSWTVTGDDEEYHTLEIHIVGCRGLITIEFKDYDIRCIDIGGSPIRLDRSDRYIAQQIITKVLDAEQLVA